MAAYYNEFDPYAAQWLRNLIVAGHIAPGEVDERSICDVDSADLAGFTQCHFFAGIGVWSHALRLAGWPDDRPVWTGSCPCQPFSAAGKRGGFDDERHLWPELFRLVRERRPPVVFGEQVASKDGLEWLDAVQADLENASYASAAADLCAAGIGAPHIRQRLYWVADAYGGAGWGNARGLHAPETQTRRLRFPNGPESAGAVCVDGLADAQHDDGRADEQGRGSDWRAADGGRGAVVRMGDSKGDGPEMRVNIHGELRGQRLTEGCDSGRMANNNNKGLEGRRQPERECGTERAAGSGGVASWMADADVPVTQQFERRGTRPCETAGTGTHGQSDGRSELAQGQSAARPTNGYWRNADWLHCRDGKWRPVEPGTFPLAHGATARVGRLRAYGNAIVPQVAQAFIEAFMECRP